MTPDDISIAYANLSEAERTVIDAQVRRIIDYARRRNRTSTPSIGTNGALELLAKLGVWMVCRTQPAHEV